MLLERDEMDHTHTHTHATTGVGDEEAMVVVDVKQNPLFFFYMVSCLLLGMPRMSLEKG